MLTAEVLLNGNFVRTTWSRVYQSQRWLITFAKSSIVVTAYPTEPSRKLLGPDMIRSGDLFEKVARVNRKLLAAESG